MSYQDNFWAFRINGSVDSIDFVFQNLLDLIKYKFSNNFFIDTGQIHKILLIKRLVDNDQYNQCISATIITSPFIMTQKVSLPTFPSQVLSKLLQQNPNIQQVKMMVKDLTDRYQNLTYTAIVQSQQDYLQAYGLAYHEEDIFHYINQLLHQKTNEVLDKVNENIIEVHSTLPPPPPPPQQIPQDIVDQVQEVLKNVDLPLSLFKRNDYYWSQDNPKTIQVKEYLKQLREEDKKMKNDLKKKRQQILNQKNEIYHKNMEEALKNQQKIKEEQKQKIIKKIQLIKSQSQTRKKSIEQSVEFMKQRGRPLFKKIQEEFKNKIQIPTLQQKKRKLSEVRQLRKSVDLVEIQQHREKYQKIKEQHEAVKIFNEPVKVAFKGNFYKSIEQSSVRQFSEDSRVKSLYDKRKEYGTIVKENFKPKIDQEKADEIAERIIDMSKRYKRAKRNKKALSVEDEDNEDEDEEEQAQPEPQPEQQQDDEDDEDDEDKQPQIKDDQYQPSNQQRYKLGLKYLQEARKRRKKIDKVVTLAQDNKNRTFSAQEAKQSKVSPIDSQLIIPSSNEASHKVKYRDYLKEMSRTNKTIDHIDTSRIKSQFTSDMKLKNTSKLEDLENKLRTIQQKAKQQEELLKYKKIRKQDAIGKKLQLDSTIIDTIRARLAMMNH